MKALTLHQPWASLIAFGIKTIETRAWATRYRGPLAIHAGASVPSYLGLGRAGFLDLGAFTIEKDDKGLRLHGIEALPIRLPLGAIVAVTDLGDVVPMVETWPHEPHPPCVYAGPHVDDWGLTLWPESGNPQGQSIDDQRPFGDFAPGRAAWLLDDVRATDPLPAKGAQGLWDVDDDIASDLLAAVGR